LIQSALLSFTQRERAIWSNSMQSASHDADEVAPLVVENNDPHLESGASQLPSSVRVGSLAKSIGVLVVVGICVATFSGIHTPRLSSMGTHATELVLLTSTTTKAAAKTPAKKNECAEVAFDWKANVAGGADDGAACFNNKISWKNNYHCSKPNMANYCANSWKNDVVDCCPRICDTAVFLPELGSVTWVGKGPMGSGSPKFGMDASVPALLFSNRHDILLRWEKKVTEMIIMYSDADFNEAITFSTNGGTDTVEGGNDLNSDPTDSWSKPAALSGSGNDLNTVKISSTGGFNQLVMKHKAKPMPNWWARLIGLRGVNGILQVKAKPMPGDQFGGGCPTTTTSPRPA